jgi:ferrous iron transport protein B
MLSRGWGFIVKAGTVILVCNAIIKIMQSFTPAFTPVADGFAHTSILAYISSPVAVLLIPLGFGIWQMAAATVSGFVAKENVVGTLAVCFSLTNFVDTDQLSLVGGGNEVAAIFGITKVAALSCLVFNLFSPPCFAAIGAMNSEISDKKWVLSGILLQLSVGYSIAFLVYQLGTLITYGTFGDGFVYGLLAVALFAGIIIYLSTKNKKDT